jgi:cyanophycinase
VVKIKTGKAGEHKMRGKKKGSLVLIGGGEDKEGDRVILKRVVELAGGEQGSMVLLGTASQEPRQGAAVYRRVFEELGMGEVLVLPVHHRRDTAGSQCRDILRRAAAVFLMGGDQLRVTSILGGTPLEEELHQGFREGLVLCGTSAGASVMSDTMLVGGEGEEPPRKEGVAMAPGLGFLTSAVVDQHFAQRGRINRLLTALAHNPGVLGIGLDENTAVVIQDGLLEVVGEQGVTLLDGRTLGRANVSEMKPGLALAMTFVTLHVLDHGCRYDLKTREPLLPDHPG